MSVESWKEEFYPVDAEDAASSDSEALAHSIKKWEGLTEESLRKHGLKEVPINMGSNTCALCVRHIEEECMDCPIVRREHLRCGYIGSVYAHYLVNRDPQPTINLLRSLKND